MEAIRPILATKRDRERNGLIDLYRFLLALVVAKSHGLFILSGPYFGSGRICVEFFFVLSGYLFFSFLQKSKSLPLWDVIRSFVKSRIFPLAFPVVIAFASNAAVCILEGKSVNIWGYLWYVRVMISTMVLLLVLRKLIKNDGCFAIIIAALMLTALVLKFFGPFYSRGDIRAVSSLPMGVLIAMLPKIKGRRNRLTWLFLFILQNLEQLRQTPP